MLIVETEPSVQFSSFDQVIQKRGDTTHIDYVEKYRDAEDHDNDDDDEDFFANADEEPLSDFEDLEAAEMESLQSEEFQTL
jgi:hypothetical protein